KALRRFTRHQGTINALAVTPKGDAFFSAAEDGTVRRWELATGRGSVFLGDLPHPVRHLALSPDGATLWTAGPYQPARAWDVASGEKRQEIDPPEINTRALALSRDGRTLVVVGAEGGVLTWDVKDGRPQARKVPRRLGYGSGAAFSPDGSRLALGAMD